MEFQFRHGDRPVTVGLVARDGGWTASVEGTSHEVAPLGTGPTTMVWGAGSVAELSQAVDGELKVPKTAPLYRDKVKVKVLRGEDEMEFEITLGWAPGE